MAGNSTLSLRVAIHFGLSPKGKGDERRPGWKATIPVSQLPPTKKAPYRAARCMLEERWRPLRTHHSNT